MKLDEWDEEFDEIVAHRAMDVLTDIQKLDKGALGCLLSIRVPINNALANSDTSLIIGEHHGVTTMSVLGIINGICGARRARVAAVTDKDTCDVTGIMRWKQ